jgi:hypothetical protein
LPALNPAISSLLEPNVCGILDIGGDPAGARVLGRFAQKIRQIEHEFLCVLNFNRPETATPEKAEQYLREIEHSAQLAATGLINNTHLCGETTAQDVLRGAKLAQAVASAAGIPILYNAFPRRLTGKVDLPKETLFPMDLVIKKPWEDETEPTREEMLCQET